MKRILVTGSNGLLGQKLTDLIVSSGRAILIATSKGANRHPVKEGYMYAEMDITDAGQIMEVVRSFKPDVIIHTAALAHVDQCENEKEKCLLLNVEAVKVLTEISRQNKVHFIHLSTDFVFDGENGPYAEDALPKPLSFYGNSKAEAEKVVKTSGCKWTIIRTILVYGVTADMSRSNIVLWAKQALERGDPLNVVNDQWRMPTLAEDLAEGCLLAAEKGAEGIYHISGRDMMSVFDLVRQVAAFWQLDGSVVLPVASSSFSRQAARPKKTGFILDKAMRDIGYAPRAFSEGLKVVDRQLSELKIAGFLN